MKTPIRNLALLVLILVTQTRTFAQYWGERVLDKGFEQTDFFFIPSTLNPFGIGSFSSTTPGLLNDPLVNLAVNPARVALDSASNGFLYADFRSARTIIDKGYGYTPPWVVYAASDVALRPYQWFYLNTRRDLEPVFSGAFIARPLSDDLPDLIIGGTYQMILQDDKYYSVPQDIYRSTLGADYAGNKSAAASSIPIVDKYSGQDQMHQRGHFVAAFGRYEIPGIGSAGIKIGRVFFHRDGGFGSSNFWGTPNQSNGTSLWSNLESRAQSYDHWELTGGIDASLSRRITIGLSGGWLWGNAAQALHVGDSSYYKWVSSPNQSLYVNSGNTQEEWRHNGHTLLFGVDLTTRLRDNQIFHLLYQRLRTTVNIGLGTNILDTSYSTYAYTYSPPDTPVTSTSYSLVRDQRWGFGEQLITTDRLAASFQWQIDARINLSFGLQWDWLTTETNTTETVIARTSTSYQSTQGTYAWRSGSNENKDLLWTFHAERSSFQIPIFLTIRASEVVEVLLGLNREMTSSTVNDVTLALFRYRQSDNNGTVTREENFGERYTEPPEGLSDVRTTFLAGLTAKPSPHFSIRFLVVPNFEDTHVGSDLSSLQWWIGLNIVP